MTNLLLKKNKNTKESLINKLGIAVSLYSIFLTLGLLCIIIAFVACKLDLSGKLTYGEKGHIYSIGQNFAAVGLYLIGISITVLGFICKYFALLKYNFKDLYLFVPLVNFYFLYINKENFKINAIKERIRKAFALSENRNEQNNYFTLKYKLTAILIIPFSTILIFMLYPEIGFKGSYWFNSWQYYTVQTNFLLFVYLLVFLINPRLKIFNCNEVLILLASYIMFVCIVYGCILLPIKLNNGDTFSDYGWSQTIFNHFINPLSFLAFTIFSSFKFKNKQYLKTATMFWFGVISPLIYLFYLILAPFVVGISVYDTIVNLNSNLYLKLPNGTQENGDPGNLIVFIGLILLFALLMLSLRKAYYPKLRLFSKGSIKNLIKRG